MREKFNLQYFKIFEVIIYSYSISAIASRLWAQYCIRYTGALTRFIICLNVTIICALPAKFHKNPMHGLGFSAAATRLSPLTLHAKISSSVQYAGGH